MWNIEDWGNNMKLIDILVMISKGELKEGTKVIYKETKFEYERLELEDDEGYSIMYSVNDILDLSGECELIEPDHFTDVGKMAEKIKELDNYEWQEGDYDYQIEILYRKLNEVIRRINNERL